MRPKIGIKDPSHFRALLASVTDVRALRDCLQRALHAEELAALVADRAKRAYATQANIEDRAVPNLKKDKP